MPVNTPRNDYKTHHIWWTRLRDCFNGRDAVLDAGAKYVPTLPGLDHEKNKAYREYGNFYNATARTLIGLTGLIFQKAPVFVIPPIAEDVLTDVTLANITMEMFALESAYETMLVGRYGVLIDMAAIDAVNSRPYAVGYLAENIINWRTTKINGDEILTRVVLRECVEEEDPKDTFTVRTIDQYRVCELIDGVYSQQLWRKKENTDEFIKYDDPFIPTRRLKPLNFIPFVFLGPTHVTPELAQPPLLDLANVNLAHWRNSVDHEYGLHQVALPTPWGSGIKDAPDGAIKLGPGVFLELELNGSAGMLEFSGSGLGAIVVAMEDKKKQMATLGARMLEAEQRLNETATAVLVRHSGDYASLRTVAQSLEQGFTIILQTMAWWMSSEELTNDVQASCELNKEFVSVKVDAQTVQVALTAVQAGQMSFKTFYNIIVTGGWAREGIDADQEQLDIDAGAPKINAIVSPAETAAIVAAEQGLIA